MGPDATAALSGAEWIDLTLTLSGELPSFWPGHTPYQRLPWGFQAPKFMSRIVAYQTGLLIIDEHSGTHFDAPCHFIPPPDSGLPNAGPAGRVTGDQVPPEQFCGPAVVVDVSELVGSTPAGMSPILGPDHLERWEAANGRLEPGDVVLLHSGWDRFYVRGDEGMAYAADILVAGSRPAWPSPSVEFAEYIHQRGVRTLGTDAPSIGAAQDGFPIHIYGLGREMAFLEGLANLARLPARGAYFIFLPLKVEGSSGAPGRAIALVPR